MSLLDILCGALGAFCFMMLVALPYYVVGRVDRAESQKRTEELMKNVENLRERMNDPAQAEELRKLIDELEAQIKQLQGELNQTAYENEQLKQQNAQLAAANNSLTSDNARLKAQVDPLAAENARLTSANNDLSEENQRLQIQHAIDQIETAKLRPFLILASATDPDQDLSLFLEDEIVDGVTNKKHFANPSFNPDTLVQTSWPNDLIAFVPRRGVTIWLSSTTKPKSVFRLFVKYRPSPADRGPFGRQIKPTRVVLSFIGAAFAAGHEGTWVNLAPERPWILAGTLQIDDQGQISYKNATEAERDDAWRAIMKSDLPTPAPTAAPSPGASLSPEDMQRIRQQAQQERRNLEERRKAEEEHAAQLHLHALSPTPAPSP